MTETLGRAVIVLCLTGELKPPQILMI